MTGITLNKPL